VALAREVLRADRDRPIRVPADGALRRAALRAAAHADRAARATSPRPPSFWLGVGFGAALAAGVALAVLTFGPFLEPPAGAGVPEVRMALNESRDVSVALDSPEPLAGAEIHVVLSGEIGLRGFAEQRELRWTTDLDRGVNQLTLPLVALGASGGQVLVEVQHGERRRAFIVDVRTTGAPGIEPSAAGPRATLTAHG
jgi:hypothetical protein